MLGRFIRFGRFVVIGAFAVAFMVGCCKEPTITPEVTKSPYIPKQLKEQARGITVAKDAPYSCKILGEVEGKDIVGDRRDATKELLREGAMNDLRNEATYITGEGKKVVMVITKEEVLCEGVVNGVRRSVDCKFTLPKSVKDAVLTSHKIQAQVYDCGGK